MSQAVHIREDGGPMSTLSGLGRRCRNYTAKLKRGESVKNIRFLYSVREYVKPSEYLRFLMSVSFRGIVTGRMCAEGLRRGLEQR